MGRILVTGSNGFVGRHLIHELHSRGCSVVALGHGGDLSGELRPLVDDYLLADLTDAATVSKLPLNKVDAVINLAGLANVGQSFDNPDLYMKINVDVLRVLGEEILRQNLPVRIVAVSTGAVYDSNQSMPLSEDSRLIENGSPYALSKIAMEQAANGLRRAGLDCVIVRPFNHIGPGQLPGFLLPDLHQKILASKDGSISVGNIKTARDYTDVRDVVRAYADLALADTLKHPVYNVCSGKSRTGQDVLDILLDAMGKRGEIKIEVDESLIRPSDPMNIYGDNSRLQAETGWQPQIDVRRTIQDFVNE